MPLFVFFILTILWTFGLGAVYLLLLYRNDRINHERKQFWLHAMLFWNVAAMVAYWYYHIWNQRDECPVASSAPPTSAA
jgi:peptidoglycan/LPS O-acetylase OafA/YrhL